MSQKADSICVYSSLTKTDMEAMMIASSAQVVKLVDTPDLGSGAARCGGSSPLLGIPCSFYLSHPFSSSSTLATSLGVAYAVCLRRL